MITLQKLDRKYVYKSTLKTMFGMTDKMIRELGEPDKKVVNRHYVSGPPASLYAIERVETWLENNAEWVARAAERRVVLSEKFKAVADKKRAETVEWARNVEIEMAGVNRKNARDLAMEYYEHSGVNRDGIIAYVRHNLTNYEALLFELSGRVGAADGYWIIKERVNALIEAKV